MWQVLSKWATTSMGWRNGQRLPGDYDLSAVAGRRKRIERVVMMRYGFRKGIIAFVFILFVCLFSGCTDRLYDYRFHPEEHIGSRWVCQELDGYFDVQDATSYTIPKKYTQGITPYAVWCTGEFTINGAKQYVQFLFGGFHVGMYFTKERYSYELEMEPVKGDRSAYNLIKGSQSNVCENGILTITVEDGGYFDTALNYTGDTLTFICTNISQ